MALSAWNASSAVTHGFAKAQRASRMVVIPAGPICWHAPLTTFIIGTGICIAALPPKSR
jgi:hypothetical protein